MNEVVWDLTYMSFGQVNIRQANQMQSLPSSNVYVVPGNYSVTMSQNVGGVVTDLTSAVSFKVSELNNRTLPASDWATMTVFKKKAVKLVNAINATQSVLGQLNTKIQGYKAVVKGLPAKESADLFSEIRQLEEKLITVRQLLNGDQTPNRLDIDGEYSTSNRAQNAIYDILGSNSNVTGTSERNYETASSEFAPILQAVKDIHNKFELMDLKLGNQSALPLLPGALPNWKK